MAPDRPAAEANESPPRLRIPTPTPKLEEELEDDGCSDGEPSPDDRQVLQAKHELLDEPAFPDTEEIVIEEEVPLKPEQLDDKGSGQSDDDLTSLSWLHQQNLLKGLELTEHHGTIKTVKVENILNNNIECEDSLDNSESTHSISSIESFSPAESIGKSTSMQNLSCDEALTANEVAIENRKSDKIIVNHNNNNNSISSNKNSSNNGAGIGTSGFNLAPAPSRSKHPTHIPYDPYLHKNSKPPYSFSCLIFMAIEDSPLKALPVKEVYAWILEHFPYFRNAPTGWKNSVRHNLSLNKCFRKVEKSPNLGKGSLWMVDAQYRPNLIQALSRSPFPPPTATNFGTTPDKIARKVPNSRLPDPVLFPYLSKRLASSNIDDGCDVEFDSDVDAAAAAMLSFKHGPVILNQNQERKNKQNVEKMVPVITRSSTEDHTYSLITSVRLESRRAESDEQILADVDEQRKIAEGADALLNLAGVHTSIPRDPLLLRDPEPDDLDAAAGRRIFVTYKNSTGYVPGSDPLEIKPALAKRRASGNEAPNKRRKRPWRDTWTDGGRYMKQVRG